MSSGWALTRCFCPIITSPVTRRPRATRWRSRRTSPAGFPRLHIGFSVQTIPLHHPVRFAERLNLIDQLTEGKVLVGIGSGTTPEEMIGLGINFKDTPQLSVSNLEIVEQLWAKQPGDDPVVFDNGAYKGAVVSRIVPRRIPRTVRRSCRSRCDRRASNARPPRRSRPSYPPSPRRRWTTASRCCTCGSISPPTETLLSPPVTRKRLSPRHFPGRPTPISRSTSHRPTSRPKKSSSFWSGNSRLPMEREHEANLEAEKLSDVQLRPPPNALDPGWQKTWCVWGSPTNRERPHRRGRRPRHRQCAWWVLRWPTDRRTAAARQAVVGTVRQRGHAQVPAAVTGSAGTYLVSVSAGRRSRASQQGLDPVAAVRPARSSYCVVR